MKTSKIIIIIISSLLAALCVGFIFIHRRVILAMIRGEELPELPKGHPHCCKCKCDTDTEM